MARTVAKVFWAAVLVSSLGVLGAYVYFRILHRPRYDAFLSSAFDQYSGISYVVVIVLVATSLALSWRCLNDSEESEISKAIAAARLLLYGAVALGLLGVAVLAALHAL
jgi:hypothetical protein